MDALLAVLVTTGIVSVAFVLAWSAEISAWFWKIFRRR